MKLSRARSSAAVESAAAAVFSLALLVTPVASIDCKNIVVDGQKFNFGELEGPHSVVTWQKHEQPRPWEFVNATYTVDLCRALVKKGGADDSESCPNGTRVCGIKRGKHPNKDDWEVIDVLAIAGELSENGGGPNGLDEHVSRLKTSESHSDSKKEGVRITMSGGRAPLERNGIEQRAVIEMLCDPAKVGTEGEVDPTGEYVTSPDEGASRQRRAEGGEEDDEEDASPTTEHQLLKTGDKNGTALIFDSYGPLADNGKLDVLRLTWYTKFACESQDDNGGGSSGGRGSSEHWGFFTWMFMLVFLGTAAYLIFGSWLNYSRYGARGWDLLPHGDTIRDIPYLLKDWTRRVMNTVQGTGSRGGYSAV